MGGIGNVGALSMRSAFASVKDVLTTGAIATAGAVITEKVWAMIGGKLNLDATSKALAQMATGIGLGVIIGKFAKRPALGVAFAIGPVVSGFLKLLSGVLNTPTAGMGGFRGITSVSMPGIRESSMNLPFQGLPQVGTGVPSEMVKYPEMAMMA